MGAFVHSTIQAFVLLSVALSFIIFVKAIPEIITYYPALHQYLVPEGVTSTTVTSVRHCRVSHNGSLQPTGTSTQLTTPTQFCTRPSTKAAKQRPSGPQHHALRLPPRDDRLYSTATRTSTHRAGARMRDQPVSGAAVRRRIGVQNDGCPTSGGTCIIRRRAEGDWGGVLQSFPLSRVRGSMSACVRWWEYERFWQWLVEAVEDQSGD